MKKYIWEGEPPKTDLWRSLACDARPILVYGMGNGADKLCIRLASIGREASDFFASDGFVRGQSFHGKRVLSLAEVRARYLDPIILVAFASRLPDVMEKIERLSREFALYIPDLPVAGDEYFDLDFYLAHLGEIRQSASLLADDASRDLLDAMIRYKLSGELLPLLASILPGDALLDFSRYRSMLDGGAYTGDTAREALSCPASALSRVVCIEPDPKNFARLSRYAEAESRAEIIAIHAAVGESCGRVTFSSSGNRNATVGEGSYQAKKLAVDQVTIDSLGEGFDYIKLDVEGEERAALLGARKLLAESRPTMRISAYHRSRDLFDLPLLLASIAENRKLYLRRSPCIPAWEADLYVL